VGSLGLEDVVGRAVDEQDVEVVGAEPAQAALHRHPDPLGAEVCLLVWRVAELRAQHHLPAPTYQRLPEQLLAAPAGIGRRGVDERDAERERLLHQVDGRLPVGAVPFRLPELPGTEADLPHLDPGTTERSCPHAVHVRR
jgi:hypothetical protein